MRILDSIPIHHYPLPSRVAVCNHLPLFIFTDQTKRGHLIPYFTFSLYLQLHSDIRHASN